MEFALDACFAEDKEEDEASEGAKEMPSPRSMKSLADEISAWIDAWRSLLLDFSSSTPTRLSS